MNLLGPTRDAKVERAEWFIIRYYQKRVTLAEGIGLTFR